MEQANRSFYFAGDELDVTSHEAMDRFIRTQAIDVESFTFLSKLIPTTEMREVSPDLFDIYEHQRGFAHRVAEGICITNIKWPIRRIFFLNRDPQGRHRLGGLPPQGLILPTSDALETCFQFIGMLDGTDPYFEWLGVPELPLIYPLYEHNEGIFLDWSDLMRPIILNPQTFSDDWMDPEETGWEEVLFDEVRYSVGGLYAEDAPIGGVPIWLQEPAIPVCPRSDKPMRFVCAIPSNKAVRIMQGHEGENLPFADEFLCFADEGTLYIFYQPLTKIMHLQIQF